MKIGSLFSGYGGLDLAVSEVTGAEVVWHCEWDDAPSKILERNFPGVPNYRDVTKVNWDSVEPVDILTGGFPCQDLSLAGKRAGLKDGTRSGLWSEFARAIDVIRPRLVVIENVRGILSAAAHSDVEPCPWCLGEAGDGEPVLRALGAVLGDLAGLGYDAEWSGVRAADAGAPHNRFRVFIIAYARGNSFAVSEGFRRRGGALGEAEALRRGNTVGVRDQVMDLVAGQGLRVSRAELLPTPNTMEHREAKTPEQIEDLKKRSSGGYRNIWEVVINELLPTPIASEGTKQDVTVTVKERINTGHQVHLTHIARSGVDDVTVWGRFEPAIRRWEAVLGRSAPAPTKPDGKDGAHRLSSEFTEWMMGLPAGWVTGCGLSRNDELKACGNGVVPAQAILALRMLLDGIDPEREREKPVMFPTPTVSDIYTDNLASSQQKDGSMHSVTLPQAVQRLDSSGEQS